MADADHAEIKDLSQLSMQVALVSILPSTSMSLEPRNDIGDGDSAIPVLSPILKLHDDLFWSIFNWNANMAEDRSIFVSAPRALTTTHQSSQVCQRWH